MNHKVLNLAILLLILQIGLLFPSKEIMAEMKYRPVTTVSGKVVAANNGPVTGVVFLEKGRLYSKNFRFGGLIDENGNFKVNVDKPGGYGIHLYATGHIYFPLSIQVEGGKDNYFEFSLPPNPAVKEAPIITSVRFEKVANGFDIYLDVTDPNKNLSHQILGLNSATGEAFRFRPPKLMLPWAKIYPDGTYTLQYKHPGNPTGPEDWYFVAADIRCYNSPIMKYPFTSESYIIAKTRVGGNRAREIKGAVPETEVQDSVVEGKKVFSNNCGICHNANTTRTKVGPGLKGLFNLKVTPVRKMPLTDENIRSQIREGGTDMPPYGYLTDSEIEALIKYLKTL
ncbi:MAG: cytochrome c [bacterium]